MADITLVKKAVDPVTLEAKLTEETDAATALVRAIVEKETALDRLQEEWTVINAALALAQSELLDLRRQFTKIVEPYLHKGAL